MKIAPMKEGFFQAIVKKSSDIILIINSKGTFLFSSDSILKTLGYTAAEIVGKSIDDFIHQDYKEYLKSIIQKIIAGEQANILQVRFLCKNGEWRWMEGYLTNMLDDEQVNGIVIKYHDITQKKYKELLEQDLQFFHESVFENHPDAVFSLCAAGNFLFVNDKTLKIFGFSKAEMTDKKFCSIVDRTNLELAKTAFTRALAGKCQSAEIKVVNKNGIIKELSITLYPVKKQDTFAGVHGIARDNTALKRANRLAKNQAITLDRTLESIAEAYVSLDKNHCFTYINSIAANLMGKDKEYLLGKNIFSVFPHLYNTAFYTNYTEVINSKVVCHFEEVSRKTGGVYSYNMYKREDGIAVFMTDISEQKRAQAELEKLSLVASKTSSAVVIVDENRKIEWVNESFVKLSGYTQEEVIGKPYNTILYGEDTDMETMNRIIKKFCEPTAFSEEILQYNRNGEKNWIAIDCTPILDENRNVLKHVCIINNITERKHTAQQLLIAKEQAEHAARAKTQFLSVMTHEIRTPMNTVIGLTNLLIEQNPRKNQLDHLQILQFSAKNLLALINDILDFTKIESGKIKFEEIDFDLQELIRNVRASLLQKAKEKNIVLNLFLDKNLPDVTGDPVRIGQVLTNLISNAVKFTEKGTVTVSAAIKNQDSKNITIDFEITDTGIGIANDKYDAIFETFTQANSDTTRKFGGTGLGLTITKRILEMLGSKILVKSIEGKGSTFYFSLTFPVSKTERYGTSFKTNPSYIRTHPKIKLLVAEDNEINLLLIQLFVKQWQFECDIAKDGLEAFNLVKKNNYDIILMDLQMPKMNGYEAAAAIRALPGSRYSNLPIIALTASAMSDIKDNAADAGINAYISKPFNPKELYNIILQYSAAKSEELSE